MQPSQPHQPSGPGPQPPYRPPEYSVNSGTQQSQSGFRPAHASLRHPNGQYEVVPPPTSTSVAPSGHNPYEFIMNPNMPKRQSFGGNNALLARVGVVIGGVIILMIAAAVVMSSLGPKSSVPSLTAIAQRQQEIIRISNNASQQVTGQDTANLVASVNAAISSSQQEVVNYLATHGTKLNAKILALDKNPQTDTLLQNAANANNYDTAVAQDLAQQLLTYEALLQTTFKQTSSQQTKQVVQDCFASANLLLQQAKALPANSNS